MDEHIDVQATGLELRHLSLEELEALHTVCGNANMRHAIRYTLLHYKLNEHALDSTGYFRVWKVFDDLRRREVLRNNAA